MPRTTMTHIAETRLQSNNPGTASSSSLRCQDSQSKSSQLDMDRRDLRDTTLWREVADFHSSIQKPAFDQISGAADLAVSPDGKTIAFTGSYWPATPDGSLVGAPLQRICLLSMESKKLQTVTSGPNDDISARWSPSGKYLIFLSDRKQRGLFQPYILSQDGFGEAKSLVTIDGNVEYAKWSPGGRKILFGVAGLGPKDGQGQSGSEPKREGAWLPIVDAGFKESHFRKLFIFDFETKQLVQSGGDNPWDAAWAGNDHIIKVASKAPDESDWYNSDVILSKLGKRAEQITLQGAVYQGKSRQFGSIAASPDGQLVAFVRGLASDRPVTVGDIFITSIPGKDLEDKRIDPFSVHLGAMDVSHLEFADDSTLCYAGIAGFETVFGIITLQIKNGSVVNVDSEEILRTRDSSFEMWKPKFDAVDRASVVTVLQSREHPVEIFHVQKNKVTRLHSFSHAGTDYLRSVVGESSVISWKSKDGLEIQGILDLPRDVPKPYPTLLCIHGGPTTAWQNTWWSFTRLFVSRGYAVLSPNPRGSTGRGQAFTEKVLGDVGGLETQDHLSGIDALIERGIADPDRLGVYGGSHGGFMTTWIVTQDDRFKACAAIAAVTDWHSCYFTSNNKTFFSLFTGEDPYNIGKDSLFHTRSPINMARKTKTPTLQIAGDVDHTVDKSQAKEFHSALLDNGVESVLAIYPGEGHGIRLFPAVLDFDVRTVGWFERWIPTDRKKLAE